MNNTLKQLIAILAVAAIFGIAYYGSYLPLRKSQTFITTLRGLPNVRSLDEFKNSFRAALEAPSPIGQEELVRNTGNTIISLLQQNNANPDLTREVLNFVLGYYEPIMSRPRGLNFAQDFYVLAALHQIAYEKTGEKAYLEKAKEYYLQGLEISPKRPQFLYGLVDLYRVEGDTEKLKEIGERILTLWPDDLKVQELIKDLGTASSS